MWFYVDMQSSVNTMQISSALCRLVYLSFVSRYHCSLRTNDWEIWWLLVHCMSWWSNERGWGNADLDVLALQAFIRAYLLVALTATRWIDLSTLPPSNSWQTLCRNVRPTIRSARRTSLSVEEFAIPLKLVMAAETVAYQVSSMWGCGWGLCADFHSCMRGLHLRQIKSKATLTSGTTQSEQCYERSSDVGQHETILGWLSWREPRSQNPSKALCKLQAGRSIKSHPETYNEPMLYCKSWMRFWGIYNCLYSGVRCRRITVRWTVATRTYRHFLTSSAQE